MGSNSALVGENLSSKGKFTTGSGKFFLDFFSKIYSGFLQDSYLGVLPISVEIPSAFLLQLLENCPKERL